MLEIKVTDGVGPALDKMPKTARLEVGRMMRACEGIVIRHWRRALSGPRSATRLGVRTGRLRDSIRRRRTTKHDIWIGTDVPYAAIHEFGGRTGPHVIVPRNASVLRFFGRDGTVVFARRVNHPGSVIPPRPHREVAMRESIPDLDKKLKDTAEAILRDVTRAQSKEFRKFLG